MGCLDLFDDLLGVVGCLGALDLCDQRDVRPPLVEAALKELGTTYAEWSDRLMKG